MSSKVFLAAAGLTAFLGFSNPADARPPRPAPEMGEVGFVIGVGGVRIDVHTGRPILCAPPPRAWIPGHWERQHHRRVWVPGHYEIR